MKSKVNEEEYIKEYLKDIPDTRLGIMFGISARTAERISSRLRNQGKVPNRKDLILDLPTERLKQQNRDLGRIDRKTLREFFWSIELAFARLYIWIKVFSDVYVKKKYHKDKWERVESTK